MEFAIGVSSIASPASRAPRPSPPVTPTLPRIARTASGRRGQFDERGGEGSRRRAAGTPCTMRPAITHRCRVRRGRDVRHELDRAPISTAHDAVGGDPSVSAATRNPTA